MLVSSLIYTHSLLVYSNFIGYKRLANYALCAMNDKYSYFIGHTKK